MIKERLAALEEALEAKVPGIKTILKEILDSLKKDPTIVTILSDEECSTLVRGLKQQTNTEITSSARKTAGRKSAKKLTVDDL